MSAASQITIRWTGDTSADIEDGDGVLYSTESIQCPVEGWLYGSREALEAALRAEWPTATFA